MEIIKLYKLSKFNKFQALRANIIGKLKLSKLIMTQVLRIKKCNHNGLYSDPKMSLWLQVQIS